MGKVGKQIEFWGKLDLSILLRATSESPGRVSRHWPDNDALYKTDSGIALDSPSPTAPWVNGFIGCLLVALRIILAVAKIEPPENALAITAEPQGVEQMGQAAPDCGLCLGDPVILSSNTAQFDAHLAFTHSFVSCVHTKFAFVSCCALPIADLGSTALFQRYPCAPEWRLWLGD